MNSCILMAKVVQAPELRYTQENQTPVTQMTVEFEGDREGEPPTLLKVVGWGNMASEMQQTYQEGDRLIIEGRLTMRSLDRPEGFKEKKAELVANRIYGMGSGESNPSPSKPAPSSANRVAALETPANEPMMDAVNHDDIPF